MKRIFGVRSPKIEIFTYYKELLAICPIVPARTHLPDWWTKTAKAPDQNIPGTPIPLLTAKHCPGIIDILSQGYILPLWSDFIITEVDGSLAWKCRKEEMRPDRNIGIRIHSREQFGDLPFPEGVADFGLKFRSPWHIKTPPGYSCLLLPPAYQFNDYLIPLPGVLHTDVYHLPIIIQTLVRKSALENESAGFLLKRGTPMYQLIPFKREKFAVSLREPTAEERDHVVETQDRLHGYGHGHAQREYRKLRRRK